MMELFDKVKNFFLGEPEEEYEQSYDENYDEEYENEQEVSNGSNVRSFGSGVGGFSQRFGFGSSSASSSASKRNSETAQQPSYRTSYSSSRSYNSGMDLNRGTSNKVLNINTNVNMQVVIVTPKTLEEAGEASLQLKSKVVILNLEGVEKENAQRITDFFSGACYALNGSIQPVSSRIFLVAPYDVNISGQFRRELEASGIKLPSSSMWR